MTPAPENKPLRPPPTKVIALSELMGCSKEIHLSHAGELYRLRVTKGNKLILTK